MRRTIGLILAGACVLVAGVAPDAAAAVLRVPGDFSTIQGAIDAAASGDRIIVESGGSPYNESIVINKDNLWIVADGRVIIDPGCCCIDVVLITGKNNRFQGFEVINGNDGIRIEGDKNSVVANVIHGNCNDGINITAGAKHNEIIANVAYENGENGFDASEDAGKKNAFIQNVAFFNSNGILIRTETIATGNVTTRNSDGFVVLGGSTKLTAQNNVMLANGEDFWDHDVEIDPGAKVNLPNLADQNVFRSLASNIFD